MQTQDFDVQCLLQTSNVGTGCGVHYIPKSGVRFCNHLFTTKEQNKFF